MSKSSISDGGSAEVESDNHDGGRTSGRSVQFVTLREALRPAIYAHETLLRRRAAADSLRAELEEILELAEVLVGDLGTIRIAVADVSDNVRPLASHSIVAAYGRAGSARAEIIGNMLVVADYWLKNGELDEVRRLATYLRAAGEKEIGRELSERAYEANSKLVEEELKAIWSDLSTKKTRSLGDYQELVVQVIDVTSSRPESRVQVHDLCRAIAEAAFRNCSPESYSPAWNLYTENQSWCNYGHEELVGLLGRMRVAYG